MKPTCKAAKWFLPSDLQVYNSTDAKLMGFAQRSCDCPWIPGSAQGQVGHWGLEQPGTVEGVHAHVWMSFKVLPNPNHSGILGFFFLSSRKDLAPNPC